jgi:hypothetical protein
MLKGGRGGGGGGVEPDRTRVKEGGSLPVHSVCSHRSFFRFRHSQLCVYGFLLISESAVYEYPR